MTSEPDDSPIDLTGQFLVATPAMTDPRFSRAVVLMCAHGPEGAMGLIVNRRAEALKLRDLASQLSLSGDGLETYGGMALRAGGPVEQGRGFVLHSDDYAGGETAPTGAPGVALSVTMDVLQAICAGEGPKRAMIALGYAGWGAGQLEAELATDSWLACPVNIDVIFDDDHHSKWRTALAGLGVDPAALSVGGAA